MPSVTINTSTFIMSRTWERNGAGPKVPHNFTFRCGRIINDTAPDTRFTLTNGGAYPKLGNSTAQQRLRLYRKLRDKAYSSMQLGADLGEGRQTLDLIRGLLHAVRSPLETVGRYMRKLARKRGKNIGAVVLKDSAEAYLAFQYGVVPLMQSIFDAMSVFSKPYPVMRVRERTRSTYSAPDYVANGYPKGGNAYIETTGHTVDLQGGFDILVNNQLLFNAEQMGMLNPLSIAWELTTLSFLVDWFLPIGTYIGSLSDYAGCTLTNSYTTTFVKTRGFRSYINMGYSCRDEAIRCNRVLGVPELPSILTMRMKWGQSKQHVANALALIAAIGLKT